MFVVKFICGNGIRRGVTGGIGCDGMVCDGCDSGPRGADELSELQREHFERNRFGEICICASVKSSQHVIFGVEGCQHRDFWRISMLSRRVLPK